MEAYLQKEVENKNYMSIGISQNLCFRAHWHVNAEVIYVIKGEISVIINGDKKEFTSGDLMVFGSNTIHQYESEYCETLIIIFHPNIVDSDTVWPCGGFFEPCYIKKQHMPKQLSNLLTHISKGNSVGFSNQIQSEKLIAKGYIYQICGMLLKHLPLVQNSSRSAVERENTLRVQASIEYIKKNYTEKITLEDIARHISISPYYLSHFFKKTTGDTIPRFINSIRVDNAVADILNTDKSIAEIALAHGFESVRNFNRVYKELKGHTPSSLRTFSQ